MQKLVAAEHNSFPIRKINLPPRGDNVRLPVLRFPPHFG